MTSRIPKRRDVLVCAYCGDTFERAHPQGPIPKYCSNAHRQRAFETRHADRTEIALQAIGNAGYPEIGISFSGYYGARTEVVHFAGRLFRAKTLADAADLAADWAMKHPNKRLTRKQMQ